MPNFTATIEGPDTRFETVTPMTAPRPTAVPEALGDIASKFLGGMARGYDQTRMGSEYQAALGTNVSPQQADANAQAATQRISEGAGGLTEEQYRAYGNKVVEDMSLDAKSVQKMVAAGKLSPLEAEAYVRKKVSAVQANPFLAAFSEATIGAAGPYGGGPDGVAAILGTSAEYGLIEAQAEGQRKAVEELGKTLSYNESIGIPIEASIGHVNRVKRMEMLKLANLETTEEANNLWKEQQGIEFEEALTKSIDPVTGLLPVDGHNKMLQLIEGQYRATVQQLSMSGLDIEESKKLREEAKAIYDANTAMLTALTKQKYDTMVSEAGMAHNKQLAYVLMPELTFLKDNGFDKIVEYISSNKIGEASRNSYLREMLGKDNATRLKKLAWGATNGLYGTGGKSPFINPSDPSFTGIWGAGDAEIINENKTRDPKWGQLSAKLAVKHPAPTLQALNSGKLTLEANDGNEMAREEVLRLSSIIADQIAGDVGTFGKVSVTARPAAGPFLGSQLLSKALTMWNEPQLVQVGAEGGKSSPNTSYIQVPEGMEDRANEIKELYITIQKNPWAWPEGYADPKEVLVDVLNGEAKLQSPEGELKGRNPLEEQVMKDEGVVESTYRDDFSSDKDVFLGGVGHKLSPEELQQYPEGTPIPKRQIRKWLQQDTEIAMADAEAILRENGVENLDEGRKQVVAEMAFQMGGPRTREFKDFLAALREGDYYKASEAIINSDWAKQTPERAGRAAQRIRGKPAATGKVNRGQ